ncbi:hypothetical protein F2P81_019407 [Scophthalmus maximus]|uniref:Uncharacterized protein n=1 Tax=Scophthalmus maximus TaxID=52904 RepID=A0A6A4S9M1_SCOMX|nr:hypothetical protein F2P81_019407 [Scophthalmus maximus]
MSFTVDDSGYVACSPIRPCVCEQERVILSVTFQDLFLSELMGTGRFCRTQKCNGVDRVSRLWNTSRRRHWLEQI